MMEHSIPFTSRPVQVSALRSRFDTRPMLALLVVAMFGGLFPIISQISRFALWGVWLLIWWLVIRAPRSASLQTLWRPALPFVVWFVVYGIWGAIASPFPVFFDVGRDLFRLITVMMAVAVLTADRDSLRRLACMTPWVLFLNLLVSIVLYERLPVAQILVSGDFAHAANQIATDRYSGLWGNANVGGMDTLILLVLSAYGRGWLVWLGRAAGAVIIYLTASRTSAYVLILIGLLFLYNSFQSNRRARWILAVCAVAMAVVWLSGAVEFGAMIPDEQSTFSRVYDPLESSSSGHTRLALMESWMSVLKRDPWCGYGYGAMGGGGAMGVVWRTDIPYGGVHNMYLGTWIDDGFFGGLSFLALLGFGLWSALRARLTPHDKTVLLALWSVALVFSFFLHNLQAGFDGCGLFLLGFLLPQSIALRYAFASQKAEADARSRQGLIGKWRAK